jgi:hypothetical protein
MSHFYASIQGNKGEATRCGTKGSGIQSHIRGWDSGVQVGALHGEKGDRFIICITDGSNGTRSHYVGDVTIEDGCVVFTHNDPQCALLRKDNG